MTNYALHSEFRAQMREYISEHAVADAPKLTMMSTEPVPAATARARLEVDGQGWQRFSRELAKEIWVSVALDDPADPYIRLRPVFALAAPSQFAPAAKIEKRLAKAVVRFNDDLEKVERLANESRLPLALRLRRWLSQ